VKLLQNSRLTLTDRGCHGCELDSYIPLPLMRVAFDSTIMEASFLGQFPCLLGVRPHRCLPCRSRFYLCQAHGIAGFVVALNRAPSGAETQQTASTELMAKAKRRWVIWDTLRNNRLW
jgi:hypothetical protein